MPSKPPAGKRASGSPPPEGTLNQQVEQALAWLEEASTPHDRENLVRFGINAKQALGVSMANIQSIANRLGRSHPLAAELWATRIYEARMLTAFVEQPAQVTAAQMDRWCHDFDNWGICDTLCFCLFDRTPRAWTKVAEWGARDEEFIKRAGFALLASLAGHDKKCGDEPFLASLPLLEKGAFDDRNFVKKGLSWALRGLGRRGPVVCEAALILARRLSESNHPGARWVGKDAVRDLTKRASKL